MKRIFLVHVSGNDTDVNLIQPEEIKDDLTLLYSGGFWNVRELNIKLDPADNPKQQTLKGIL